MSFVAVDLGASSTRYVSNNGKFLTIPNNVVFIEKENGDGGYYMDAEPVDIEVTGNNVTDALEVIINHPNEKEVDKVPMLFPMHALIGYIAESYSPNNSYPSASNNKYTQRINYLSTIVSVALSKLAYNLDDNINVYIALPPSEVKEAKEKVASKLVGCYEVTFPKYNNGTTVKFNIVDVKCAEESAMAVTSYFFNIDGSVNENASKYLSGIVLSLDIGASTTDLAIVKNGKFLDKSGRTYRTGGNNTRDEIIEYVQTTEGFKLPPDAANEAMAEGRLKFGNTYKDISNAVNDAKRSTAESLITDMDEYFSRVKVPLQSINAIIVSGGGSMRSQYIDDNKEVKYTSKPMSDFITEAMKDRCDGIVVESHSDNPRFANIHGLFIRAQFDANR